MQLNKPSKKTSKAAEKPAISSGEKTTPSEPPKARVAKSSKTKKSEGAEMTSGKNLHKPATPAIGSANVPLDTITKHPHQVTIKPETGKAVAHEDIAKLAFSYWIERGGAHGSAQEDWLRAERELNTR